MNICLSNGQVDKWTLFPKILLRKLLLFQKCWDPSHNGQHSFPHWQTASLTDKPAVVALLHHIHNVALFQLQLVFVAWQIVVHGLVPAIEKQEWLK